MAELTGMPLRDYLAHASRRTRVGHPYLELPRRGPGCDEIREVLSRNALSPMQWGRCVGPHGPIWNCNFGIIKLMRDMSRRRKREFEALFLGNIQNDGSGIGRIVPPDLFITTHCCFNRWPKARSLVPRWRKHLNIHALARSAALAGRSKLVPVSWQS